MFYLILPRKESGEVVTKGTTVKSQICSFVTVVNVIFILI